MKYQIRVAVLAFGMVAGFNHLTTTWRPSRAAALTKPETAAVEVKIDNFAFGPNAITVAVGTKVTWTNHDDIPHTVVSNDQLFKSKVLDTDQTFSFTFDKPGTFPYFCSLHPKMTGKVIVQ